jgi:hypothetical protein
MVGRPSDGKRSSQPDGSSLGTKRAFQRISTQHNFGAVIETGSVEKAASELRLIASAITQTVSREVTRAADDLAQNS